MIPLRDTLPSRTTPILTWTLIAANVLVFLAFGSEDAVREFGAVAWHYSGHPPAPSLAFDGQGGLVEGPVIPPDAKVLRSFAHMFVHGGFAHLLGNLWFLWIFGDNVEDRLGRPKTLALCFAAGYAALALQVLSHPGSGVPMVGASGAVSGVLGAYAVAFPTSRVVTLVPVLFYPLVFALPARLFLGFWFVFQVVSGIAMRETSQVAWWAHVGGFALGALGMAWFGRERRERVRVEIGDPR